MEQQELRILRQKILPLGDPHEWIALLPYMRP
jgi:hypothetical protein